MILARHGKRLLKLLDDSAVVPGDMRPTYGGAQQARQILNDAEDDLRDWSPEADDDGHGRHPEQDRLTLANDHGHGRHNTQSGDRRDSGFAQHPDLDHSHEYDKENREYGYGSGKDLDEARLDRDMETTREAMSSAGVNGAGTRGETYSQGERPTSAPRKIELFGREGKARLTAEYRSSTQLPHQCDGFDTPKSVDSDGSGLGRGEYMGYSSP